MPPAVSRKTGRPSAGKRVRSSLALASAALLGLMALVATPRCVGERIDASTAKNVSAPTPVEGAVAKAAALPVAPKAAPVASTASTDLPTGDESARATSDRVELTSASVETSPPPVARPAATVTATAKPTARPARPTSNKPVRVIGSERPVHGGISSPGF